MAELSRKMTAAILCIGFIAACIYALSFISTDEKDSGFVPQPRTESMSAVSSTGASALPLSSERTRYGIADETSALDNIYWAGLFDGRIAVFSSQSSDTPELMTDISVSTLTADDRRLLEKRIALYGRQGLTSFLEDFGS